MTEGVDNSHKFRRFPVFEVCDAVLEVLQESIPSLDIWRSFVSCTLESIGERGFKQRPPGAF